MTSDRKTLHKEYPLLLASTLTEHEPEDLTRLHVETPMGYNCLCGAHTKLRGNQLLSELLEGQLL